MEEPGGVKELDQGSDKETRVSTRDRKASGNGQRRRKVVAQRPRKSQSSRRKDSEESEPREDSQEVLNPVGWSQYEIADRISTEGSFLPVLDWALRQTSGQVLEVGSGFYSTPYLAQTGRDFVTLETDPAWRDFQRARYHHTIIADINEVYPITWSVVFVDRGETEDRLRFLDRLKFEIAVVHDLPESSWTRSFNEFPYHRAFGDTTVLAYRELK